MWFSEYMPTRYMIRIASTQEEKKMDENSTTENTENKEQSTIVDPKYRDRYKSDKDWATQFIEKHCVKTIQREVTKTGDDGTKTTELVDTKKTRVDLEALFDLAAANGIDARAKYGDQIDRHGAPGRLRMTVGNMLRAAAKHRHGLFDVDGEWNDAPEDFLAGVERTHERDGTKIAKPKPEKAENPEAENEAA